MLPVVGFMKTCNRMLAAEYFGNCFCFFPRFPLDLFCLNITIETFQRTQSDEFEFDRCQCQTLIFS